MGIDYSSAIAYGFEVDKDKAQALYAAEYEEGGVWEVMEAAARKYPLLGYAFGGDYDAEDDMAIVVRSTHKLHGYRDGAFGVFPITSPVLSEEESAQLVTAYSYIGKGPIGSLAIFNCS